MQSVNIAELKNNLSHYLRKVRQGIELTIKDRDRVVARIIPVAPPDIEVELRELAEQGKVKLPQQLPDTAFVEEMMARKVPRMKTKGTAARELLQRLIDEERNEP